MTDAGTTTADATEATSPARAKILDGAAQCFRRFGVAKTTLEDIATEAGTSRATVYRTIPGGRDEIVLTVLLAEARAKLDPIRDELDAMPTFEVQLIEGLAGVIELSREDPQLAMLFTAETVSTTVVLPGAWEAVLVATTDFIAPLTARARSRGELRSDLSDSEISDWLCRVIVSIIAFPGELLTAPTQLRDYLRTFLIPSLVNTSLEAP